MAPEPHARSSVRVLAPAKINTWLDVLGKRADGYHEVETFLVAIDRCDVVTVTRRARRSNTDAVSLTMTGPHASADIPLDARNLAVRAAALVLARARAAGACDADAGLDLHLEKNVPSQSGLGGASADAAAAWLGARAVCFTGGASTARDTAPTDADQAHDLASLGSDTVFFGAAAATGAAWCRGRGELVRPAPSPSGWSIALVTPAVGAPTGAVYAALGMSLRGSTALPTVPRVEWSSIPAHDARARLGNSLEIAALAAVPELARWRRLFDEVGASHFRLSGSGSSFFGLYESDARARADLDRIAAAARAASLTSRVCDVVHPSGHGARLLGIP